MTRHAFAAVLLAAMLISGCGAPVGLRTQPGPISACMDALATGVLVTSNLSGLAIRGGEDRTVTEVEWPFEYTARHDGVGVVLVDSAGQVIAREGQLIQMGGGTGADGVWHACPGSISLVAVPE
jgi:hypothetical protein